MEYMEHSNFYAMCDKIRKMEARELKLTLEAHGGGFVWIDDENDEEQLYEPPIIMVQMTVLWTLWFIKHGWMMVVLDY